jgi:hypothetical protein
MMELEMDLELDLDLERDARGKPNLSPESSPILLPVPDSQIPREMVVSEAYGNVTKRQRTAALLLQAIVAEPKLTHLVRHVHLDREWGEPLFINMQVSDIFSRVGRLEELSVAVKIRLHSLGQHALQHAYAKQLRDIIKDAKVAKIKLTTPSLTALGELLLHTHAESIQVHISSNWYEIGEYYGGGDWLPPFFSPNWTCIDFGKFAASPWTIEKVLTQARYLESFSTTIQELFRVTSTLQGSSGRLHKLALLEATDAGLIGVNRSRADLINEFLSSADANFASLKQLQTLTVTSSLCFDWAVGVSDESDNGFAWRHTDRKLAQVHTLLPSSIETLEVQFIWRYGIFAKGVGYHTQFPSLAEKVQIKACEWIVEFAKHKVAGGLPNFKVLKLVEVGRADYGHTETHRYEPPSVVADAFINAGIDLYIQFLRLRARVA